MRFHTQTAGSTLTAQQPENNIVRTTLQALAAVLGGTQSLHTNAFDEALGLPTEHSATIALRTQQIIAYESGVADTVDPLAGSYFVESLTDAVEEAARRVIGEIDAAGGAVAAVESGVVQRMIEESAYREARRSRVGRVGRRRGQSVRRRRRRRGADPVVDPDLEDGDQVARVTCGDRPAMPVSWRACPRRGRRSRRRHGGNLLYPMKPALAAGATLGEVSGIARRRVRPLPAGVMTDDTAVRFLVIGGGPGGVTAATAAASLGADVTLVESSIVGGAAHLWDCIPSKALVASSMRLDSLRDAAPPRHRRRRAP